MSRISYQGATIESGYERDRFAGRGLNVRWWFFVHLADARPQEPRRGVADEGFRFARGGRVADETEALIAVETAAAEADREIEFWRGQPSHALGPRGELLPLDRPGLPA